MSDNNNFDLNKMADLVAFANFFIGSTNLDINHHNKELQLEMNQKLDRIIELLEKKEERK